MDIVAAYGSTQQDKGELKTIRQDDQSGMATPKQSVAQPQQNLLEKYGWKPYVSQEQQQVVSSLVENSDKPLEDSYRYGAALAFSQAYNKPVDYCMTNLDSLFRQQTGMEYKPDDTSWTAIKKSFTAGNLTVDIQKKEFQWRNLVLDGKDNEAATLEKQIMEMRQTADNLQDSIPRPWYVEALKWTAGTLPYTARTAMDSASVGLGATAVAGAILGGAATPAAGGTALAVGTTAFGTGGIALGVMAAAAITAATFKETNEMFAGDSFWNIMHHEVTSPDGQKITMPVNKKTAGVLSLADGIINGLVESEVGFGASITKQITKGALEKAASWTVAKLYAKGITSRFVLQAASLAKEGALEGLQEATEEFVDTAANELSYRLSDQMSPYQSRPVIIRAMSAFGQAFVSTVIMGGIPSAVNTSISLENAKKIDGLARAIPGEEAFQNVVKDMRPEEVSKADWRQAMKDKFDAVHQGMENTNAVNRSEESAKEEWDVNARQSPDKAGGIVRGRNGKLQVYDRTEAIDTDGQEKHVQYIYDPTPRKDGKSSNTYGTMRYTLSPENKITIDSIKTGAGYEAIRTDAVKQLSEKYPGAEINWEPRTEVLQREKQQLIEGNPLGKERGLTYYDGNRNTAEHAAAMKVVKSAFPNMSIGESSVAATVLQLVSEKSGKPVQQMLQAYRGYSPDAMGKIAMSSGVGNPEILKGATLGVQQAMDTGVLTKEQASTLANGASAVIYAGKYGDFTTFSHETFHLIRKTLMTGSGLEDAISSVAQDGSLAKYIDSHEELFDTGKDGEFTGMTGESLSNEILKGFSKESGWTRAQEEIAARLWEGYLREGKAPSSKLQVLFDRIAEYFRKIYHSITGEKLDKRITDEFDKLFPGETGRDQTENVKTETGVIQAEGQQMKPLAQRRITERKEFSDTEKALRSDSSNFSKEGKPLAPNGNPSALSYGQWVTVRTPAFKAWFGDWEHDPENASKVIDENGEPEVVYHNTTENFSVFREGKNGGLSGNGIYFSEYPLGQFGPVQIQAFLDIRHPITSETELDGMREINSSGLPTRFIPDVLDRFPQFDGVMNREEMTVRSSSQIKSATANSGAFDSNNPDILFQNKTYIRQLTEPIGNMNLDETQRIGEIIHHQDSSKGWQGETLFQRDTNDPVGEELMRLASTSKTWQEFRDRALESLKDSYDKENPPSDQTFIQIYRIVQEQQKISGMVNEQTGMADEEGNYEDEVPAAFDVNPETFSTDDILSNDEENTSSNAEDVKIDRKTFHSYFNFDGVDNLTTENEKDDYFTKLMADDKGAKSFLEAIGYTLKSENPDENERLWAYQNGMDQQEIAREYDQLKARIGNELDPWQRNLARKALKGNPLSSQQIEKFRQSMTGEATKWYRDIFARLVGEDNLQSNTLPNLEKYGDNIRTFSIQNKLRFIQEMRNKDLANAFLSGKEKLIDGKAEEIRQALKSEISTLRSSISEGQKALDDLKEKTSADKNRMTEANRFLTEENTNAKGVLKGEASRLENRFGTYPFPKTHTVLDDTSVFGYASKVSDIAEDLSDKAKLYEKAKKMARVQRQDIHSLTAYLGRTTDELIKAKDQLIRQRMENEKLASSASVNESIIHEAQVKIDDLTAETKELEGKLWAQQYLLQDQMAKQKEELQAKYKDEREAEKVRDYKLRLASIISKQPSSGVDYEYRKTIISLQQALDPNFRRTSYGFKSEGTYLTREQLDEMQKTMDEGELRKLVGDRWADRLSGLRKPLNEWTVEDLEKLAETIQNLTREGTIVQREKVIRQEYEAEQVRNAVIMALYRNKRYKPMDMAGSVEDTRRKNSFSTKLISAELEARDISRVAQMLDGDVKGEAYDVLVTKRRELEDVENRMIRARDEAVISALKKSGLSERDLYATHSVDLGDGRIQTLTNSALMYAYLSQSEDRNRFAVSYGNLVTHDDKVDLGMDRELIRSLGDSRYKKLINYAKQVFDAQPEFRSLMDAIQNDFDSQKKTLQDVSIREFNDTMEEVVHYLPIRRQSITGEKTDESIRSDLLNRYAGNSLTGVQQGFRKSRIDISPENQTPVNLDLMGVWNRSVHEQSHFIAFAGWGKTANRIFKSKNASKNLQTTITNVYGKPMIRYVSNYINEVINPQSFKDAQDHSNMLKYLRGNLAGAYLGFKPSSIVLQAITSPMPFLASVNPGRLMQAYAKVAMHPMETWNFVSGKSEMMRNRSLNIMMDEIRDISNTFYKTKGQQFFAKQAEIGTRGLEWIDRFCVSGGWLALYTQYKAQLQDDKANATITPEALDAKAVRLADEETLRTQPTGNKLELAPLFKQDNDFARAVLQFTTSLNVIWNNVTYDVPQSIRQATDSKLDTSIRKKAFARALGQISGYAFAGLLLGMVQEGFKGDDDDKDKRRKLLFWSTTQFVDSVPILGRAVENGLRKVFTGDNMWYPMQIVPAAEELLEGMSKALYAGVQKSDGTIDQEKLKEREISAWKEMGKGFGQFLGVPTSGITEGTQALKALAGGNPGKSIGTIVGR